MLALGAKIAHRLAHANRGGDPAIRRLEGRHHRIPNGLHNRTVFGSDDLLEQPEMLVYEIEGDEVADTIIKLGRASEVAEQESEAQDFQALANGQGVGPVDVAERLIGEEALCGEYGLASLQKGVQRLVGNPYSRQYPTIGAVLQGEAQRPRAQGYGVNRD